MSEEIPAVEIQSVEGESARPSAEERGISGPVGHEGVPGQQSPPAAPPAAAAPPPPPPTAPEQLPPAPSPAQVEAPSQPKVMPAEWPCAGYSGPQPWEADNTPALTQNHVMVGSGSAGQEVVELGALLAHLGYGTSISGGQNPHAIYDGSVREAVQAFCRDYGVAEDPAVLAARTEDTVGPWIWEALTRAVHLKVAREQP